MKRRIFVDTEWTAPPWSAEAQLMWVGLADEEGRSWYGISSEVDIDPLRNDFLSGVFRLISPDERRMSRRQLSAAVVAFCGEVDEFWAWIPSLESFTAQSGLGDEASDVFGRCRNIDLQMLQALVNPWPPRWPTRLHDLNRAAATAGVEIPARTADHLHPRVHAEWNGRLFELVRATGSL